MKTEKKHIVKKTAKKKKVIVKSLYPIRNSSDLPVTQGMLLATQKMLSASIRSVNKKTESIDMKIGSMDKRFESIDKRFDSIDKKFESIDKRFDSMDLKLQSFIEEIRADRHQIKILVETQESRNKFVLEGYEQLYHRQDRLESKVEERLKNIEDVVFNKIDHKE